MVMDLKLTRRDKRHRIAYSIVKEKNKVVGLTPSTFKSYYKVLYSEQDSVTLANRSVEQQRETRRRPT